MSFAQAKYLVVIDPGHGGTDHGATFVQQNPIKKTFVEKELTLIMAKELANELRKKKIEVVLTRNGDQLLELSDRTALANRLRANLFISLHMNSSQNLDQRSGGIETYILSNSSDEYSKRIADIENKLGKAEKIPVLQTEVLSANLKASTDLACTIQSKLTQSTINRGVKHALFYVLLTARMPSLLIETGFINAKDDRDRVYKKARREKMVSKIVMAIEEYRAKKVPKQCLNIIKK